MLLTECTEPPRCFAVDMNWKIIEKNYFHLFPSPHFYFYLHDNQITHRCTETVRVVQTTTAVESVVLYRTSVLRHLVEVRNEYSTAAAETYVVHYSIYCCTFFRYDTRIYREVTSLNDFFKGLPTSHGISSSFTSDYRTSSTTITAPPPPTMMRIV